MKTGRVNRDGLFLKKLMLPKKCHAAADAAEIEVAEFLFRRKIQPNGYITTVAIVIVPGLQKGFIGVSACAPVDVPFFDETRAPGLALGRARQLLTSHLCGRQVSTLLYAPSEDTMRAIFDVGELQLPATLLVDLRARAERAGRLAAQNAFLRSIAIQHDLIAKQLSKERRAWASAGEPREGGFKLQMEPLSSTK